MVRRVGELILAGQRGEASALLASIPEEDRLARPAPQMVTQEKVLRERDRRGLSAAPQRISDRYRAIGEGWRQFGEVRHDLTLRLLPPATKLAKSTPDAA